MKYIITLITTSCLLFLIGCTAISNWWNGLNLTDIANTLSPTIQAASKYTVYAVCEKNPDLAPIFEASANGLKLAVDANAFDSTQIKKYIEQALGAENAKWSTVVFAAMDSVIVQYEIIYNKYINSSYETNDKINGFKIMLTAMSTGIIEGSKMQVLTSIDPSLKTSVSLDKIRIDAINKLKLEVSKF